MAVTVTPGDYHHLHIVTPAGRRLNYKMQPEGRFVLEDGRDLDAVLDDYERLKARIGEQMSGSASTVVKPPVTP